MKTNRKIGLTVCLATFLIAGSVGIAKLGTTTAAAASNDILTDEEVAALWTEDEYEAMVTEGGTVGSATGDKLTGSFKATSANGVAAGGETVDKSAGDFSVILMGDQQTAVEYHSAYVASSYNWIAANADEMNLKMYVNLGDIVDDVDFLPWVSRGVNATVREHKGRMGNWKMQLEFVSNQVDKLHAAGVPAALVMGNHDYEDMANNYRMKENFNSYFPISKFEDKDYFGDSMYGDVEAAYYYFDGANADDKYMVVTLGCYPTDSMLAWANAVVAENADRKVIVALHSYVDTNSEGGDLTQTGARIWDNFLSLHENVFLVACGHECTDDGSIWNRVDYGVHGNPVYQFMINPQKEDFGGAGMFSQLIFRADGTVDVVSYSPYVAEHEGKGYFMDENQFTFTLDLEKLSVAETAEPIEVGNILTASEYVSYLGRADEDSWKYSVYDYYNVTPTLSGLQAVEGTGYVTHKLYAGEFNRFNVFDAYALGEFGSGTGAYQIDLSTDGEVFSTVYYQNAETGSFNFPVNLERFVAGAEYVYIRLYVKDVTVSKLSLAGGVTKTVISTQKQFAEEHDFTKYEVGQWNYTNWEKTGGAIEAYFVALAKNNPGGAGFYTVLGSGASGRLSYKSYLTYRFDSGAEGRTFEKFAVDYTMSATDPEKNRPYDGYESDDTDTAYLVRILVSTDDGKTWTTVNTDNYADLTYTDGLATHWNQIALDEYVEDAEAFLLKLEYMGYGSGYGSVGFKKITFGGEFNKTLKVDEEEEEIVIDYALNGGYFANGEKKDPVREGYAFKGWYDNAELDGNPVAVKDVKESCTLYAKWERTRFSVVWMLDGGVNSERNPRFIETGERYYSLAAPTKEGFTFLGWFDENGNRVTELVGENEDIVLYARWEVKKSNGASSDGCGSVALLPTLFALVGASTVLLKKKKSEK